MIHSIGRNATFISSFSQFDSRTNRVKVVDSQGGGCASPRAVEARGGSAGFGGRGAPLLAKTRTRG
jgi:hypothetical protein